MTNTPPPNWSERLNTVANLAVVAGIVFLAVEIQQNTAMMEAQIQQSRAETAISEQHAYYNSDYIPALMVKVANAEELTNEELLRYRTYIRGFNRNMDNQLWQYDRGFLDENIPPSVGDAVRTVIGSSELALQVWEQQRISYTDRYVSFVDSVLAEMR